MTTPGYKKCTLCGEEMIIDAILCPHCGRIPGRTKAATPPPAPRSRRKAPRLFGIALSVGSLVAAAAGLTLSDATLLLAAGVALALGVGLVLFARR